MPKQFFCLIVFGALWSNNSFGVTKTCVKFTRPIILGTVNPVEKSFTPWFVKLEQKWQEWDPKEAHCYPESQKFLVTFDGKTLTEFKSNRNQLATQLSGQNTHPFSDYARTKIHPISIKSSLPKLKFLTGGTSNGKNVEIDRSFVATNVSAFSDPEKWHITKDSIKIDEFIPEFHRTIKWFLDFLGDDIKTPLGPLKESEVKIFKAYKNSKGDLLVGIQFKDLTEFLKKIGRYGNGVVRDGEPELPRWFIKKNGGKVQALTTSTSRNELFLNGALLDAGDYDADGKVDFLFQVTDEGYGTWKTTYNCLLTNDHLDAICTSIYAWN